MIRGARASSKSAPSSAPPGADGWRATFYHQAQFLPNHARFLLNPALTELVAVATDDGAPVDDGSPMGAVLAPVVRYRFLHHTAVSFVSSDIRVFQRAQAVSVESPATHGSAPGQTASAGVRQPRRYDGRAGPGAAGWASVVEARAVSSCVPRDTGLCSSRPLMCRSRRRLVEVEGGQRGREWGGGGRAQAGWGGGSERDE